MDEILLTETRGPVRLLTMNCPAKLNALNAELVHALTAALQSVQADSEVSVVVLAGAGRAFCAGADTSAPRPLTTENRPNLIRHGDANIALTDDRHCLAGLDTVRDPVDCMHDARTRPKLGTQISHVQQRQEVCST